ncbi:hypothetical protein HYC85_030296 [Camellia sinensis]|uniref:Uncharacterized protein n=1 Tax=Camellia sinensis TaxID=4442 RepID=A0A7J7G194_CAMSI|nr:hypothetical protein HYC85_030296 [Camellia sinensis]
MSPNTLAILSLLFGAIWWLFFHHLGRRKNSRKILPPGPRALPIIGNLHMIGTLPHRALEALSKKYGPIMLVQLGNIPTIVVSSPRAAELFLKTHDTVFASRPNIQAAKYMSYENKGMAFATYGSYWRNVKKLCTLELLSVRKIDGYEAMRREEMEVLVQLLKAAAPREVVDLSEMVAGVMEDMTCKMVFGRSNDERFDLKTVVQKALVLVGAFNIADFVPILAPFDLQGLTRSLKETSKAIDTILEIIITEHEQDPSRIHQTHDKKDFIDVMLSLMNNKSSTTTHDELSYSIDRNNIKAIAVDMLVGAIDTSTTAIEWVMSEILTHSRVAQKLQQELMNVVGGERMVAETDLVKLEYLEMIIKETLRIHPVAPLLIPRESMEDIVIDGYFIPKNSRILVNSWAMGQDPSIWSDDVGEFLPERFMDGHVDIRGRDFQLIPFGSGRRGCPGMHLGLTNIRLVVAQLMHCFDWELPNGMKPNELDMSEKFGLSLPRAKHLLAIPTYRL